MSHLRPALVLTALLLALCCVVYPAIVTAGAQVLFKDAANGSLVVRSGIVRGSALIGQSITDWDAHPQYVWGRPSAASNDAATGITYSSGSNYGPSNPALVDEVRARVALLRASGVDGPIPIDLVTKSASGLDPDLSPEAVELQLPRIARARHASEDTVRAIVRAHTEGSFLGLLGEPRVHVLQVNLELDERLPYAAPKETRAATSATMGR